MTATAWSHLPNAKHIDRILSDIKANPDKWVATIDTARSAAIVAAWGDAWGAAHDALSNAARNIVWDAARNAARDAASNASWVAARNAVYCDAWDTAHDAAYDAALALVAYDDCAYLLDEKLEDVKMMALLGNPAAVLLYSACVALQKEKE